VTTLFISDLHLSGARPDITAQFLHFLQTEARSADALYILGDLFEFWIGDDDTDPEGRRVTDGLRALTRAGVPCYLMQGNRDFLLGRRFRERTGCRMLDDPTVVDLYGQPVLLLHGDTLCTDDHSYQRLRRIVRNPFVQWIFARLSLARREKIATRIRAGSQAHTYKAAAAIMDVNQGAVVQALKKAGVRVMVHGHTHRPAVHALRVDGEPATRIVLGDWYEQGSVLRWDRGGYELVTLDRR
jgi:UDP-2,3-diacylglucosamine hydrolase